MDQLELIDQADWHTVAARAPSYGIHAVQTDRGALFFCGLPGCVVHWVQATA